ncbi:hypothetical protein CWI38_0962p0040, partial [Hamiltosporidium tvaerminnensis]
MHRRKRNLSEVYEKQMFTYEIQENNTPLKYKTSNIITNTIKFSIIYIIFMSYYILLIYLVCSLFEFKRFFTFIIR